MDNRGANDVADMGGGREHSRHEGEGRERGEGGGGRERVSERAGAQKLWDPRPEGVENAYSEVESPSNEARMPGFKSWPPHIPAALISGIHFLIC